MGSVLLYEVNDKVATLTINRPPFNPLNPDVITLLTRHLEDLYRRQDVHVLIIRGAGEKAFCAGADINHFVEKLGHRDISLTTHFHHAFQLLSELPIPVITELKGHVLGGGLELALACDFRVCDEKTTFALPEINLGIFPGAGGTQRLPRLIGYSKAMEMMMFGTSLEAKEAERLGLVNKVADVGYVAQEVEKWAHMLTKKPKNALEKIKKVMSYGRESSLASSLRYEAETFAHMFLTYDAKEGVNAFLEKREAKFLGK